MLMNNLVMYRDNYEETSGSLWYYREDDPNDNITDSDLFKFKLRPKNNANKESVRNLEKVPPLKH